MRSKWDQPPLGTIPRIMHIHPTRLARVRGWVKSQILWCNAHNIQVGAHMAKLVVLQCRNLNLGLATKARACKVVGQEGTLGGTFHALGSAKECEGMNPHTLK